MDTTNPSPEAARKQEIEAALAQHIGSLERTRHWSRRLIDTPGTADMAEQCQAFWLIDVVASHQIDPKVQAAASQVWQLTVAPDRSAAVTAGGGMATC